MTATRSAEVDPKALALSHDLDFMHQDMADEIRPFEVFRLMREREPVKRVENLQIVTKMNEPGPTWMLSRYRDVVQVFQDSERFSTAGNGNTFGVRTPIPHEEVSLDDIDPKLLARVTAGIPLGADPPDFFKYRSFLNPMFSPKSADKLEDSTREIANRLIDDFAGSATVDFHSQFARPLPSLVTCRLLGLPESEWEFYNQGLDVEAYLAAGNDPDEICSPSVPEQMAMLRIAAERRKNPKDDILTKLAQATVDGRLLNFYELGAITSVLLSGGVHTTTTAIESAIAYLGRHPETRARLVADPSLIHDFIEEVLRMWPPVVWFFRRAKEPVEIDGHQVNAGERIMLGIAAANRDPEQFEDPDTFILGRRPNRHITFSVGIHRCIGSNIARQELLVAMQEILRRLPEFSIREEGVQMVPVGEVYERLSLPVEFATVS